MTGRGNGGVGQARLGQLQGGLGLAGVRPGSLDVLTPVAGLHEVVVFPGPAQGLLGHQIGRLGLVKGGGGNDLAGQQIGHPLVIFGLLVVIGLGLGHCGLGFPHLLGAVARLLLGEIGPGGFQAGLGRLHFVAQVLGLQLRHDLAGLDFLALFEINGGDFAGHLEAQVGFSGLNVTGTDAGPPGPFPRRPRNARPPVRPLTRREERQGGRASREMPSC